MTIEHRLARTTLIRNCAACCLQYAAGVGPGTLKSAGFSHEGFKQRAIAAWIGAGKHSAGGEGSWGSQSQGKIGFCTFHRTKVQMSTPCS